MAEFFVKKALTSTQVQTEDIKSHPFTLGAQPGTLYVLSCASAVKELLDRAAPHAQHLFPADAAALGKRLKSWRGPLVHYVGKKDAPEYIRGNRRVFGLFIPREQDADA